MRHKLSVPGLVCQACVVRVTTAVHALDSAARIEADLATQQVSVETDMDLKTVRDALLDEGYPTQPLTL